MAPSSSAHGGGVGWSDLVSGGAGWLDLATGGARWRNPVDGGAERKLWPTRGGGR